MSETQVSTTVAFLFGGMVFLLTFTRLGQWPTIALAFAILVGYLVIEAWHAWRNDRRRWRDEYAGTARLELMREWDRRRFIDWSFTDWSDPEFSDIHDYRKADRIRR